MYSERFLSVSIILASILQCCCSAGWGYDDEAGNGPAQWPDMYPTCGGMSQSPIDVITNSVVDFTPPPLVFTNYDSVSAVPLTLANTGHGAQVSVNVKDITVKGGGLNGTYTLEQFHFHWGRNDDEGAEHLVDTASHSMEIHFVHYNSDKYSDVSTAVASGDREAVAVLGVFTSLTGGPGGTPSKELQTISENIVSIPYRGNTTSLEMLEIGGLLPLASSRDSFYRYHGSLTTPECNEVVLWTVFTEPIYAHQADLVPFREMLSNVIGEPDVVLDHNFRPVQPLNGRTVNKSPPPAAAEKKKRKK